MLLSQDLLGVYTDIRSETTKLTQNIASQLKQDLALNLPPTYSEDQKPEMPILIGLAIKGVKSGYKSYQKHQAEKDNNARGTPQEIIDPSNELTSRKSQKSSSCPFTRQKQQQLQLTQSNNSTESFSSVSTAEAEERLRDDVEFQQFMKRQRQAYLAQHPKQVVELPAPVPDQTPNRGQPPSYEASVAYELPVPAQMQTQTQTRQLHADDIAKGGSAFAVSPVSARYPSTISELDGSPISTYRSSQGSVAELPGDTVAR